MDPQLIFQRLVAIGERRNDDLQSLIFYELRSHPTALFDTSSLPLQPKKGALGNAIWDKVGQKQTQKLPKDGVYILDGGT